MRLTKKHKNHEFPELKNRSFLGFWAHFGRPKVMKNDDFLEAWKCWFSIGIYSISEHLGGSEIDKKRMQKVWNFMKIQACKKTWKSMIFGDLGRCLFGGSAAGAKPLEWEEFVRNFKNLEHALHPFGGGGSQRFAHAAAPFSFSREAWGIVLEAYIYIVHGL